MGISFIRSVFIIFASKTRGLARKCKCQYKIVGFLSYKNVGKPTRLYDILYNLIFLNHILHLIF